MRRASFDKLRTIGPIGTSGPSSAGQPERSEGRRIEALPAARLRLCTSLTFATRVKPTKIPTLHSYLNAMHLTDKGQVTIPKRIRVAAGVAPGSEVSFSLEGSRIVITPVAANVKGDRRAKLRAAAARVRDSLNTDFKQLGADEIMAFLRGEPKPPAAARRGRR